MSSQTQIDQVQVSTDAAEDAITFKAEYDAEEGLPLSALSVSYNLTFPSGG